MNRPLRAVIADDQALVRTGFRMILAADGIEVAAEAADGEEAVAAVRRTRPDVVLMDIRMPRMDGLEATRRILGGGVGVGVGVGVGSGTGTGTGTGVGLGGSSREAEDGGDRPRVLILTTYDLDQYVYAALSAGASGFLLKDVSPEHLVASVRLVQTGDALLAPVITRRLIERFARRDQGAGPRDRLHRDLSQLTPRELEVLRLMASGLSNAELADRLVLGQTTVKTHVARILGKLGLRDRVQAVVLAYETGLVTPGGESGGEEDVPAR